MEETTTIEAPAHYSPNQLVTYKVIDGSNVTYNTDKVTTIEYELDGVRRTQDKLNKLQSTINLIIDNLTEDYWFNHGAELPEVLQELCEIVGHNPIKTVEFSASILVTGNVDIPLSEAEDFDLETCLGDTLSVDSYNGDTVIDGWQIEYINEF